MIDVTGGISVPSCSLNNSNNLNRQANSIYESTRKVKRFLYRFYIQLRETKLPAKENKDIVSIIVRNLEERFVSLKQAFVLLEQTSEAVHYHPLTHLFAHYLRGTLQEWKGCIAAKEDLR